MDQICLSYRSIKGYKYHVASPFRVPVPSYFAPLRAEIPGFASLSDGYLLVNTGYAWDGPSGPVIHTKNWLKPSLVHDVFYQMLRNELFSDFEAARENADDYMYQMLLDGGMSRFRAWYSWKAVRKFGKKAASASQKREVYQIC